MRTSPESASSEFGKLPDLGDSLPKLTCYPSSPCISILVPRRLLYQRYFNGKSQHFALGLRDPISATIRVVKQHACLPTSFTVYSQQRMDGCALFIYRLNCLSTKLCVPKKLSSQCIAECLTYSLLQPDPTWFPGSLI